MGEICAFEKARPQNACQACLPVTFHRFARDEVYTGSCGEHGLPCPPSLESKSCNVNSCAKVSGKVDGVTVGGWSCGAPQSQSSGCVSGVAPGITFDIGGDALKDAQTCFCGSDLCNTADFTGGASSPSKSFSTILALFFGASVLLL